MLYRFLGIYIEMPYRQFTVRGITEAYCSQLSWMKVTYMKDIKLTKVTQKKWIEDRKIKIKIKMTVVCDVVKFWTPKKSQNVL